MIFWRGAKSAKIKCFNFTTNHITKETKLQINKYNKKMFKLFLIIKLFTFIYTKELYM